MGFDFTVQNIKNRIFEVSYGLEKECLRVSREGFLSHSEHGFDNEHIQRDFCENQVEFVTDVFPTAKQVCSQLRELHRLVQDNLAKRSPQELLWCFSNPPFVKGENDVPIANFVGSQSGKSVYRRYLAEKYGKLKMLYSGIHFNFSFDDSLINAGFEQSGSDDFYKYKNSVYLELAQKLVQYSWLIVYLTASSPVIDNSFIAPSRLGKTVVTDFASARCSEVGYWNDFVPTLKYGTVEEYVNSIEKYVADGKLRSPSELYYPIRLKPRGKNSLEALKNGINHIELRMLDVNPLSDIGVIEEDIRFLHLLIIYLMSLPKTDFNEKAQITAIQNEKTAAKLSDLNYIELDGKKITVQQAAIAEFEKIKSFFNEFDSEEISRTIEYQQSKINNPNRRYANIVIERFGQDYVKKGLKLAEKYQNSLLK